MTTCSTVHSDSTPTRSAVCARWVSISGNANGPAFAYMSPNFMLVVLLRWRGNGKSRGQGECMRVRNVGVGLAAVLIAVGVAGCGGGGGGSGGSRAVQFTTAPAIAEAPNARAPLVRVLTFATDVPTRVEATLSDGGAHTFTVTSQSLTTTHADAIVGFKPGRDYDVTVAAIAADGGRVDASAPLHVTTAALPATFPRLDVHVAAAGVVEPGFTLFGARSKDGKAAFVVIIDSGGEVVWYLDIATSSSSSTTSRPTRTMRPCAARWCRCWTSRSASSRPTGRPCTRSTSSTS